MAQPIYCDFEGCDDAAALLVSRLADGETLAWCEPHWGAFLAATAQAAGLVEPTDQAPAEPDTGDKDRPDADDEDQQDQDALRRLEAASAPRTAEGTRVEESAGQGSSEAPGPAGDATDPAQVVRRGTSRSRRRHEAKLREKGKDQPAELPATE
jgi:hypothetical protein